MFADLIRDGLQALIEAEASETIGVCRYERTGGVAYTAMGTDPRRCMTRPVMSWCRVSLDG